MSLPLHLMRHAEPVAFVRLPGGQEPDWDCRPARCRRSPTPTARRRWCVPSPPCRRAPGSRGHWSPSRSPGHSTSRPWACSPGLLEPLAKQGISILALSTYDTDWILIGAEHADEAMATWKRDGNTAAPARLSGGTT